MAADRVLSHDEAISKLRGQLLRVPDLKPIFAHWPAPAVNPNYEPLVPFVNDTIRRLAASHPLLEPRIKDDIALLTCLWYPRAAWEELQTLALYATWLVCWDDTVDANEGDLSGDWERAEAWRTQSLSIIERGLWKDDGCSVDEADALNALMVDFGSRLRAKRSLAYRRSMCDEVAGFIVSCGVEQQHRLKRRMSDYEGYMSFRERTVGGESLCHLVEHAEGFELRRRRWCDGMPDGDDNKATSGSSSSSSSRNTESLFQCLVSKICVLLSLVNDLLSLRKELRTDCVINAVACLLTPDKTLDDVVVEMVGKMRDAVRAFDTAAEKLMADAVAEEQREATQKYVQGCRGLVTGTLEFTLKSPRYNIAQLMRENGALHIPL